MEGRGGGGGGAVRGGGRGGGVGAVVAWRSAALPPRFRVCGYGSWVLAVALAPWPVARCHLPSPLGAHLATRDKTLLPVQGGRGWVGGGAAHSPLGVGCGHGDSHPAHRRSMALLGHMTVPIYAVFFFPPRRSPSPLCGPKAATHPTTEPAAPRRASGRYLLAPCMLRSGDWPQQPLRRLQPTAAALPAAPALPAGGRQRNPTLPPSPAPPPPRDLSGGAATPPP